MKLFLKCFRKFSEGDFLVVLAIRQNTEHSRLEHFVVSKTLGKGWCGEVGEDHPFFT